MQSELFPIEEFTDIAHGMTDRSTRTKAGKTKSKRAIAPLPKKTIALQQPETHTH